MNDKTFGVLIVEMSHYGDVEGERLVAGFPSFALAREFARRWVRDSLEELRGAATNDEELRCAWALFGEDAIVIGAERYAGSHELDDFISQPATPEERDWQAIQKQAGITGIK